MNRFHLLFLTVFVFVPLTAAEPIFEPPVPVRTIAPEYPADLRLAKIVGVVVVSCIVTEEGNVSNAAVEKTTNPGFSPFALAALRKWKFKPAKLDGTPVAKKVLIPIKFSFEE